MNAGIGRTLSFEDQKSNKITKKKPKFDLQKILNLFIQMIIVKSFDQSELSIKNIWLKMRQTILWYYLKKIQEALTNEKTAWKIGCLSFSQILTMSKICDNDALSQFFMIWIWIHLLLFIKIFWDKKLLVKLLNKKRIYHMTSKLK